MKKSHIEAITNKETDYKLDPADTAILSMRSKLISDLQEYIKASGLTQIEAAQQLGIAQSRVSNLMRGQWHKFSLEMLITLESRIGRTVTIELDNPPAEPA